MEQAVAAREAEDLERQMAAELAEWEQVIQDRLQAFFELGYALKMIREKGLYRLHHSTFEDYCAERWDFSERRANQLITSSVVRENLKQLQARDQDMPGTNCSGNWNNCSENQNNCSSTLPQNESQARVVAQYSSEPTEQLEFWQKAVQTAPKGRVTATHLKQVAAQLKGAETPSQAEAVTRGGRLTGTFCLFCRNEDREIFSMGNSRQGICESCTEDAVAHHTLARKRKQKEMEGQR